jgi:hypothetical protein
MSAPPAGAPAARESRLAEQHPLAGDGDTVFHPGPHLYVHLGEAVPTSVTAVLKKYWPAFDGERVIAANFFQWKASRNHKYGALIRYLQLVEGRDDDFCRAAIARLWAEEAQRASRQGTRMHEHLQCLVEGWPLPDGETAELRLFRGWLAAFCAQHALEVWRAEWIVVHKHEGRPVVAGQIDLLLRCAADGSFWAVDYKRTDPAPKRAGGPLNLLSAAQRHFSGETGEGPFSDLANTDFNKYTAQLNAYAYIAHANHGVDFRDRMFVLQIHPTLSQANCVQVARMDAAMQSVFAAEARAAEPPL